MPLVKTPLSTNESTPEVKAVVPTPILKKKRLSLEAFEEEMNTAVDGAEREQSIYVEPVAIDENLFENVWQEYIQLLTDEGNAGMAASFAEIVTQLNFNKIVLEISSASIEELIKKDKARLIEFFRKHLLNQSVEIETKIAENAVQKNIKSLSSKERLNEMISQNPNVLKLIQDLGLELDY